MSFGNLTNDHDEGDVDCPGCEEQFGFCSCGGVVHCEYQETPHRVRIINKKTRKAEEHVVTKAILVLECDRCDEYEVQ